MDRPTRSLLAWFDQDEAVKTLLGHVPAAGQDVSHQVAQWTEKQKALAARIPYTSDTPVIEPFPESLSKLAVTFTARPDVQAMLAGFRWELGVVNLAHVLSYQKIVVLEGIQERVAAVREDDWEALFSLCLPDAAAPTKRPLIIDPDGKGITLTSLNPNLRVLGHIIQKTELTAGPGTISATIFGFTVKHYPSFVQVVEYNGRWFVRDGYHRCYGLLATGITRVPCVFIRANNFQQTGAEQVGFFPEAVLLSERPPLLKDFLDDAVSVTVQQRATRKVVRITAQEFVVDV